MIKNNPPFFRLCVFAVKACVQHRQLAFRDKIMQYEYCISLKPTSRKLASTALQTQGA